MDDVIKELTRLYIKEKELKKDEMLKISKANLIKFSIKLIKTIENNRGR